MHRYDDEQTKNEKRREEREHRARWRNRIGTGKRRPEL
jgi:hypothetical protein